jgi:hypothetical protein
LNWAKSPNRRLVAARAGSLRSIGPRRLRTRGGSAPAAVRRAERDLAMRAAVAGGVGRRAQGITSSGVSVEGRRVLGLRKAADAAVL